MMKKYIIVLFVAFSFSLTGCENETTEPGGTAVEKMAGDWWVTYQNSTEESDYLFEETGAMPDENNIENWTWDYLYDDAHSHVYTFNTAANLPTEMFITDKKGYWDYKVKTLVNYKERAFTCPITPNLAYEGCDITIIGGKILEGAATTPSGVPADSIVFYIKFSDDEYGFTYTKVSGFRRTGFEADDF